MDLFIYLLNYLLICLCLKCCPALRTRDEWADTEGHNTTTKNNKKFPRIRLKSTDGGNQQKAGTEGHNNNNNNNNNNN